MTAAAVEGPDGRESRAYRGYQFLSFAFFVLLSAVLVVLTLTFGFVTGLALTLGVYLLFHVPVFAVRGEEVMAIDEPPKTIQEELASVRNPLTSLWIARADRIHEPQGRDDDRISFSTAGLLGRFRKQYVIDVEEDSDDEIHLEIRREDSTIVTTRITIEGNDDGTSITIASDRTAVDAFSLVLMTVLESTVRRHLATYGYDPVESDVSVRMRSLFS